MPREQISIPGYARFLDALCDDARDRARVVVGNSMGGFVGAELAVVAPQRVERLVLVSAAGIANETVQRADRDGGRARARAADEPHDASSNTCWRGARGLRAASRSRASLRHADRLPAPSAYEQMHGAGKPGFLPALAATGPPAPGPPAARSPARRSIVWGKQDRSSRCATRASSRS